MADKDSWWRDSDSERRIPYPRPNFTTSAQKPCEHLYSVLRTVSLSHSSASSVAFYCQKCLDVQTKEV